MSNVRSAQTDKVRFFGNTTPQELAAQYGTLSASTMKTCCAGVAGNCSAFPAFQDSM